MRSYVPVRAPVGRRQVRVCAEHTVPLRFNIKQRLEFGASFVAVNERRCSLSIRLDCPDRPCTCPL